MRLVFVVAVFVAVAIFAAVRGRRRWKAGDLDAALTAAAWSTGAMFIAIISALLGALQ
jgi:hypothetical protein